MLISKKRLGISIVLWLVSALICPAAYPLMQSEDSLFGEVLALIDLGRGSGIRDQEFSPDGSHIALATRRGVEIRRSEDLSLAMSFSCHTEETICVAFSPDGMLLASGSADGSVAVWSVASGTQLSCVQQHPADAAVYDVAFSPDCSLLASGSWGEGQIVL